MCLRSKLPFHLNKESSNEMWVHEEGIKNKQSLF